MPTIFSPSVPLPEPETSPSFPFCNTFPQANAPVKHLQSKHHQFNLARLFDPAQVSFGVVGLVCLFGGSGNVVSADCP